MPSAYYNEHDSYAADWLRNLITAGHIAAGVVDERSIDDVCPADIVGFTQCHFFAGIGVWSHALRSAGWPDDRPVWTGSCPCQPFSAAGKGAGFADERHLWPAWHHLIRERRPAVVFGEQVASADSGPWIDLVQDDLEALGYAFGAVPFPAASVGAPHIRDRLYFVANAQRAGVRGAGRGAHGGAAGRVQSANGQREWVRADAGASGGVAGFMGNANNEGLAQRVGFRGIPGGPAGANAGQAVERASVHVGVLGNPKRQRPQGRGDAGSGEGMGKARAQPARASADDGPSPTNGFWLAADWIVCRDGRWRPVEPGTFPLASGVVGRVGQLRAYGNAICAPAATAFITAAFG